MINPYKLTGPTCLSFSGGRTSAYMLWLVLQSNTSMDIARWLVVCFANTGKEDEATLRFVQACSEHWEVTIVWLEYRKESPGFAVVDFHSAAREGEPFAALIQKRNYLPNPVTRFCTSELKIRTIFKYLRDCGLLDADIDMMIGIRADEQRRVAKIRNGKNSESAKIENTVPLADAGVTVADVGAFWDAQSFNLELTSFNGRTLAGNCDLCFLKPAAQIASLIAEKPERAVWWASIEALALALASKPSGAVFRSDRPSYAAMAKFVTEQRDMFNQDEEAIACFCGD